jgi:hypothetical protein
VRRRARAVIRPPRGRFFARRFAAPGSGKIRGAERAGYFVQTAQVISRF